MLLPEKPTIFIKDKTGKIYKRLPNGMVLRANFDDIKKLTSASFNTPTPYTNLIKRNELPNGNSNS